MQTDMRELNAAEVENVSGANPAIIGFLVGYFATKVLDDVTSGKSWYDYLKEADKLKKKT